MARNIRIFRIPGWRAIKPIRSGETAMTIKTDVKAGSGTPQHNETLVVRSDIKAGALFPNHNETLMVRSNVKAGGIDYNHNESLRRQ
jgi:hypothetical protein